MYSFILRKTISVLISLFLLFLNSFAGIKTWTGAAGDGLWATPSNWSGNLVPSSNDDVLLDNSAISGNYIVSLPNTAVVIKTLSISPDPAKIIQLILPASNIMDSAFTAIGPGYGLLINKGGVFQNSSGLTSGESLNIADSIRINNGGKYVHRTRASHANSIVRLLSTAPGTEEGIFEFDVPRASYTVSMSNRTYGTLMLSAIAAGGAISYTCNGSNTLTVNGNLQINEGVNFSVDLGGANGNISIKGDYIQNGGIFNIASGAGNSTSVSIRGNLVQSSAGSITETNTGLPSIELNGNSQQVIFLAGNITNNINFRMNNPEGAILLSPLRLPYKLELIKGKIITSSINLLTLQSSCSIVVDSTSSNNSFIDGPLRKEGLSSTPYFLFPVGKNASLRWLELKSATGSFVVEYIKSNPRSLSNVCGAGIDHVSPVEYWTIQPDSNPIPSANVELSFHIPESGAITDLNFLDIASLSGGIWMDAGQSAVTGAFNTAGSVVSTTINNLPGSGYFSLASTADLENPLPVALIDFNGNMVHNTAELTWHIDLPGEADYFEVMTKRLNDFEVIAKVKATGNKYYYQYGDDSVQNGISFYRLRITDKAGIEYLSKIIAINNSKSDFTITIAPAIVLGNRASLRINSARNQKLEWIITSMDGRIIKRESVSAYSGNNIFLLDLSELAEGMYQLTGISADKQFYTVRFIKQ
jgi:hypothetical protein